MKREPKVKSKLMVVWGGVEWIMTRRKRVRKEEK